MFSLASQDTSILSFLVTPASLSAAKTKASNNEENMCGLQEPVAELQQAESSDEPHTQTLSNGPGDNPVPKMFYKFLELPAELRELVYQHYFDDDEVLFGPKGQPRAMNANGLLWVSRHVHAEAKPNMFKKATFTLNVAREYGTQPERDFAYMLDHHFLREEFVPVSVATVHQFQKVRSRWSPCYVRRS